jgi:lipoprotein-releasing system permease protein
MKRLEWYIARRYLASRRKGRMLSLITWIAVGGIFLGVMALIVVIAVMTGLQRDLQSKIIGTNPHIYVFQQGGLGFRMAYPNRLIDSLRGIPGIRTAQPFLMTQVGLSAHGQIGGTGTLYGIVANKSARPMNEVQKMIARGEKQIIKTNSGKPGILLGEKLAITANVGTGDLLKVISLENIKTGPTGEIVPVIVEFEVTGTFRTGMYEYDKDFMYAEIKPVQELLSLDSTLVSGVAVNVEDPWKVEATRALIDAKLGFEYWTDDWKNLNRSLFSALKLEKLAMAIILSLIVLVAAFNIISTLIMVVADKTREIGILKSMGLTDAKVLRIFMLQGLAIGLIGTVLGTLSGLGLVWILDRYKLIELPGDVYFIDQLPVALETQDLVAIVLTSMVIAFAATIYPARQASKLLPVEAIRHE